MCFRLAKILNSRERASAEYFVLFENSIKNYSEEINKESSCDSEKFLIHNLKGKLQEKSVLLKFFVFGKFYQFHNKYNLFANKLMKKVIIRISSVLHQMN